MKRKFIAIIEMDDQYSNYANAGSNADMAYFIDYSLGVDDTKVWSSLEDFLADNVLDALAEG